MREDCGLFGIAVNRNFSDAFALAVGWASVFRDGSTLCAFLQRRKKIFVRADTEGGRMGVTNAVTGA